MRRIAGGPALALAMFLMTSSGRADPIPGLDPIQQFAVTPQAGAWMISAACFPGEVGKELSRQLVLELRNKHHLQAYIFNLNADKRKQEMLEDEQHYKETHPGMPYRPRRSKIEDQWAVLVGGYRDIEAARAVLPSIRKLPMPDLKLPNGKVPFDTIIAGSADGQGKVIRETVSPYLNAMCVPNPSIPHDPNRKKYDKFWETLNANEEFSLLRCKKAWTFAIKEYRGMSTLQPSTKATSGGFMDSLSWFGGKKEGQALDASAAEAHRLAETLKKLNFEVYVFHTRTSSIVTVGSFDNPNDAEAQRVRAAIYDVPRKTAGRVGRRQKAGPVPTLSASDLDGSAAAVGSYKSICHQPQAPARGW